MALFFFLDLLLLPTQVCLLKRFVLQYMNNDADAWYLNAN